VSYRCTTDIKGRVTETQYRHGLYNGKVPTYEDAVVIKWRKGIKMREELLLESGKIFVRTWFANGHPRSGGTTTKAERQTNGNNGTNMRNSDKLDTKPSNQEKQVR
jgi:hypothetical protein